MSSDSTHLIDLDAPLANGPFDDSPRSGRGWLLVMLGHVGQQFPANLECVLAWPTGLLRAIALLKDLRAAFDGQVELLLQWGSAATGLSADSALGFPRTATVWFVDATCAEDLAGPLQELAHRHRIAKAVEYDDPNHVRVAPLVQALQAHVPGIVVDLDCSESRLARLLLGQLWAMESAGLSHSRCLASTSLICSTTAIGPLGAMPRASDGSTSSPLTTRASAKPGKRSSTAGTRNEPR